ncbi:MAG: class I SAM-dependent methyltransferase [Planctomycetota bacterium]|jgi:SAM-dependent methyltransferase
MSNEKFLTFFDRFVKWPLRLKKEGPFVTDYLEQGGAKTVVDAGAGTGRHAAYLALKGYRVTATDLAPTMIEETARYAAQVGAELETIQCGFEELADRVEGERDAVICLGNSICMLPDLNAVERAVAAFAGVLKPGGLLLMHLLNYVGLRGRNKRISRPTPLEGGGVLVKFFDLEPGATRVNFLSLTEPEPGKWKSEHQFAPLLPLSRGEMESVLTRCGFSELQAFGGADGSAYETETSYDLFLRGTRRP